MTVIVFGSINMDLVAHVPHLPAPGETLTGGAFATLPGGKGANQAVACARLGAPTCMVGRVGEDVFGAALLESLKSRGVETSGVCVQPGPSGLALINLDAAGENTIVIIPGANVGVAVTDLIRLGSALDQARLLLLQLEVRLEAVRAAAQLAHDRGIPVILDPAPARPLPEELYRLVDVLTPNEREAAVLAGVPVDGPEAAGRAARLLLRRGPRRVVVKLGGRGAFAVDGESGRYFPAFPVKAVDTVAAGDAFNGGLAAALAEDRPFDEAVRWGMAAGALAVTRPGAQSAMPDRQELLALLASGETSHGNH